MSAALMYYRTEDGEPWAIFAYGHIDRSSITLTAINGVLDEQGHDPVGGAMVDHLWMYADHDDAGEDGLFPWNWCEAGTPDAVAVTGVKFQ